MMQFLDLLWSKRSKTTFPQSLLRLNRFTGSCASVTRWGLMLELSHGNEPWCYPHVQYKSMYGFHQAFNLKRDKRQLKKSAGCSVLTLRHVICVFLFFFYFQEEELGSQVLSLLRDRIAIAVSRSGEPAGSSWWRSTLVPLSRLTEMLTEYVLC